MIQDTTTETKEGRISVCLWIGPLAWLSFLLFIFLLPFRGQLGSILSIPRSLLLFFMVLGLVRSAALGRWVRTGLDWPIWTYCIVMLVSAFLSVDVRYSVSSVVHDLVPFLIVFHTGACLIINPGRMRQFIWMILTASALVLFLGFFPPTIQDGRLQGIFPVATRYGKYLDLLIPVTIASFLNVNGARLAVPIFLLAAGQVGALAWNATRGAIIGIFSSLLFMSVFRRKILVALVLTLIGGGLFLGIWPATDYDLVRVEGLFRSPARLIASDPALKDRKGYFRTSISFIRERPVLGWGYGRRIARFVSAAHDEQWYLKRDLKPLKWHAHNMILEILLEGGILGLVAAMWISWRYVSIVYEVLVRHRIFNREPVVLGLVGAIMAISIHSMVSVPQWSNTLLAVSYISVTVGYFSKKSCAGCGQPI